MGMQPPQWGEASTIDGKVPPQKKTVWLHLHLVGGFSPTPLKNDGVKVSQTTNQPCKGFVKYHGLNPMWTCEILRGGWMVGKWTSNNWDAKPSNMKGYLNFRISTIRILKFPLISIYQQLGSWNSHLPEIPMMRNPEIDINGNFRIPNWRYSTYHI